MALPLIIGGALAADYIAGQVFRTRTPGRAHFVPIEDDPDDTSTTVDDGPHTKHET